MAQRAAQHLDHVEPEGPGAPGGADLDVARLGRQVEQHIGQRHRGLAVDRRVVQLGDEAHLLAPCGAARKAFDHVHLPQRPVAVQQDRVQQRDLFLHQRTRVGAAGAAAGQPDLDDVFVEVGFRIHPGRVGHVQRHPPQPAAQHRRGGQAGRDVSPQVVHIPPAVAGRQLQQVHGADVHRHLRRFQVEEGGVQAGELSHAHGVSRCVLAVAGHCGPPPQRGKPSPVSCEMTVFMYSIHPDPAPP